MALTNQCLVLHFTHRAVLCLDGCNNAVQFSVESIHHALRQVTLAALPIKAPLTFGNPAHTHDLEADFRIRLKPYLLVGLSVVISALF